MMLDLYIARHISTLSGTFILLFQPTPWLPVLIQVPPVRLKGVRALERVNLSSLASNQLLFFKTSFLFFLSAHHLSTIMTSCSAPLYINYKC